MGRRQRSGKVLSKIEAHTAFYARHEVLDFAKGGICRNGANAGVVGVFYGFNFTGGETHNQQRRKEDF